jgi:hypothetical protein
MYMHRLPMPLHTALCICIPFFYEAGLLFLRMHELWPNPNDEYKLIAGASLRGHRLMVCESFYVNYFTHFPSRIGHCFRPSANYYVRISAKPMSSYVSV